MNFEISNLGIGNFGIYHSAFRNLSEPEGSMSRRPHSELFDGPFLQPLVVGGPADPFSCLLIEKKGDASAVAFVIFLHPFRIGFVMPYFKFRYV